MKSTSTMSLTGSRILLVDDDQFILEALKIGLAHVDCEIFTANDGAEALAIMAQTPADIVVSDMNMPNMNGQELLQKIAEQYPETIRMVLTANAELSTILAAVNGGRIWGYMEKPWDNEQLVLTLEQAMSTHKALAERSLLRRTLEHYQHYQKKRFEGFIGESVAMQCVYKALEYCAPSNASVFITGQSGTGKEVAAAAIHHLSKRKQMPFIALNCAAIPSELMESEIFGHIKGAFSGAMNNRDGAASLANGGTLFFDEIGEMDIGLQAKLLRFIQTGCFQKVGSDKTEKVDIRFICATNRDPHEAIKEQKLREDLYYRLNVVSINLPSLSEREADVIMLAQYFLKLFSEQENKIFIGIASEAEAFILGYAWPGNVRQLQNAIHNGVVMSDGPLLTLPAIATALGIALGIAPMPIALPNRTATMPSSTHPQLQLAESTAAIRTLAEVEREAIEYAVAYCDGNIVDAACALELSPSTLYRKIQIWQK